MITTQANPPQPLFSKPKTQNKMVINEVLTDEEFKNRCKKIELEAEKVAQENTKILETEKLRTARNNKKIQKMIHGLIEDFKMKGEAIPSYLTDILKKLK